MSTVRMKVLYGVMLFCIAVLTSCSGAPPTTMQQTCEGEVELHHDHSHGEYGFSQQALINCSERKDTGYVKGKSFSIVVVTVDGKPVERSTANAYYVMQQAAAKSGVSIRIVSGFRTMSQQKYLYNCYLTKKCNNGNLAAKPGYSNHQSGHALDLNTSVSSVYRWLSSHGGKYGFKRTVPSEKWHWEWWGGGPGGGPCGSKPECSKNSDCKKSSAPRCYQGKCIPLPPSNCLFVKTTRLSGANLNIRASTNTSSSVVGSVPEGACLAVIQKQSGQSIKGKTTWYRIDYKGSKGWISAAYADCSSCGGVCQTGQTQSCYTGPAKTKGVGPCKAGTQSCSSGKWGTCKSEVKPTSEACDGKDNDCDGKTDESLTKECYTGPPNTKGIGACVVGQQTCSDGKWSACKDDVKPADKEVCGNEKDDNCDGQVDEDCPTQSTCKDGDTRACYDGPANTKNIGACKEGQAVCENGSWSACQNQVLPGSTEQCGDEVDNNCNGEVDEGCSSTGTCIDNDQDGYGVGTGCTKPQDCRDDDPSIHPNAPEICGNGIDEDCQQGDLPCGQKLPSGQEGCRLADDCQSGLCARFDGVTRCSVSCKTTSECPQDMYCTTEKFCWPKNATKTSTQCAAGDKSARCFQVRGSGCSCQTSRSLPEPTHGLLGLLVMLLWFRRRKTQPTQ